MSNPGPAVQTTVNTQAEMAPIQNPQHGPSSVGPIQGTNGKRCLAIFRGINLAAASGTDIGIAPVVNSLSYIIDEVVAANGQVSGAAAAVTTAQIAVFTASAAGGTNLVATAALTSLSAAGSTIDMTIVSAQTHVAQTAQTLYVNLSVSLANATCDLFIYGKDIT